MNETIVELARIIQFKLDVENRATNDSVVLSQAIISDAERFEEFYHGVDWDSQESSYFEVIEQWGNRLWKYILDSGMTHIVKS